MAKLTYVIDWNLVQALPDLKVILQQMRADLYVCEPADLEPAGRYADIAYLLVPAPLPKRSALAEGRVTPEGVNPP